MCNSEADESLPTSGTGAPLVQLQSHDQRLVLEHYPQKLSTSGRYAVRLDSASWVRKGTREQISRDLLMVALQKLQRILIRATDMSGTATMAQLQGVKLDVAVASHTSPEKDRRPKAMGVEMCHCPPSYSGTSCQNPGNGYYRWTETNTSYNQTWIDWWDTVKPCQCNGRSEKCQPENGSCQDCRDNTTGPACEICAGGYYGNPLLGETCLPCQCPDSQHNHAATCSIDSRGQFMCQCQVGYTGPRCDRCDYGYFGDSNSGCFPCDCNSMGSTSNQCDQTTGQCYCVRGVTGRDCSQCQARQVLTSGGRCKDCNHACLAPLLDTMDDIAAFYANANVSDIDPAPMLRLQRYQGQTVSFNQSVFVTKASREFLATERNKLSAIRPHAELTMLEAKKYEKAAWSQDNEAKILLNEIKDVQGTAETLVIDIQEIIRHLKHYGLNTLPHVSITRALNEARQILATIKGRNYADDYNAASTELSYARQSLNAIKDLLFDRNLEMVEASVDQLDSRIDDLLQYLNRAMKNDHDATAANQEHYDLLVRAQSSSANCKQMVSSSDQHSKTSQKLLQEAKKMNLLTRTHFTELNLVYEKLGKLAQEFQSEEADLSTVIKDYKIRYVEPCLQHATQLVAVAEAVSSMFGKDRGMGAKTLEAANAYHSITMTVLQSVRASDAAFTLAIELIERVSRQDERGYDLFAQADVGRVKSRDLRQEAEGLRQNSREMQVQVEELILRWQSYILLVSKRNDDLKAVDRELDRLQIVSVLAEDAVRHSSEALRQATAVHENISGVLERITKELRSHVREMQSFSPEELGNIPRKLTEARRHLQKVDKRATYLSHRKVDIEEVSQRLGGQIQDLKNKIAMARHAAESVKISITNQRAGHPEASQWGCSRSYRVNLTSSMSTTISLVYAVTDIEDSDGLLVYLPSGEPGNVGDDSRDYMAIEMVNRRIRFLWNNGGGTMAISHNTTIEPSTETHRDLRWYKITAERVGNTGRLNVRLVKPVYVEMEDNRWVVGESSASAHVLNLHRKDLLYVGGGAIPEQLKSNKLLSSGTFSGVLFHLEVDGRVVGLWNLVTSAGCRETHSGVLQETHGTCYAFRGDGYAVQRGIRHYDPRYLSLSIEFNSFESNALLFYGVNEYTRQHLLLELRDGRLYMELNYGPEKQLSFLTSNTYNGGGWVQAEVARALRNNVETGVLRVTLNGIREDLMDTIALPTGFVFQMKDCVMFFGGMPPTYDTVYQRTWNSFLGQMRAITISNPGSNSLINPLYTQRFNANPYYGVVSDCNRQRIKEASFNGEAYLEVQSQPLRPRCTMGFAFQTFTSNGLLLLADNALHPYSIALVDGQLFFRFMDLTFTSALAYNDGKHHTVSIAKNDQTLLIYVDDKLIKTTELPPGNSNEDSEASGGLYVGGLPYRMRERVEKGGYVGSINGLIGTIMDIAFIDDRSVRVVDMNQPLAIERAQVGRVMYFPTLDWNTIVYLPMDITHRPNTQANSETKEAGCVKAVMLDHNRQSRLALATPKRRRLHLKFDLTSTEPNGVVFVIPLTISRRRALLTILQEDSDTFKVEVTDSRGQVRSSTKSSSRGVANLWTKIELHIQDQALLLSLNGHDHGTVTLPKRTRVVGPIYFGHLTEESTRFEKDARPRISGCVRHLKLNGLAQDLWSLSTSINLGQCKSVCI